MGDGIQALCFHAGANSIFYGEKLLTTGNPDVAADQALFERLGLHAGVDTHLSRYTGAEPASARTKSDDGAPDRGARRRA
jgi:biotin synthase